MEESQVSILYSCNNDACKTNVQKLFYERGSVKCQSSEAIIERESIGLSSKYQKRTSKLYVYVLAGVQDTDAGVIPPSVLIMPFIFN
jgi:hypothetical protein